MSSANAATSTLFLGHNGEFWDFWLIVSVLVAATVAAAVGVTTAGSIISHKREAEQANRNLILFQTKTEKDILDASVQVALAQAESEKAKTVAAQANERSVALGLRANETALALERARIEQLQLQDKLAWRTLGKNRATFVDAMKKFSGTSLDIVVYPTGTSDIGPLQNEVTLALGDAGWTVRRWNMMGTEFVVGVGIAVAPNETDKSRSIANALALSLNNAGVMTGRIDDLPDRSFPVPAVGPPPVGEIAPIRMLIGTKPE